MRQKQSSSALQKGGTVPLIKGATIHVEEWFGCCIHILDYSCWEREMNWTFLCLGLQSQLLPLQGASVAERASATCFSHSRHSANAQNLAANLPVLSSGVALTQHLWHSDSEPSSLLASAHQHSYQQSSPIAPGYDYSFQFSTPATALPHQPPFFSTGSSKVPPSPFRQEVRFPFKLTQKVL